MTIWCRIIQLLLCCGTELNADLVCLGKRSAGQLLCVCQQCNHAMEETIVLLRPVSGAAQLAGGGLVPLSHAVCCRPCLPEALPEDPTGVIPANDSAVAVVSIGCHASTSVGAHPPFRHQWPDCDRATLRTTPSYRSVAIPSRFNVAAATVEKVVKRDRPHGNAGLGLCCSTQ